MTKIYLQVMLLSAPAFLSNNLLQCFVRNDGTPSLSMAVMITGSFSNIFLDYLFVIPLQMGIFGAILATGLSPIISMAVLSPYFFRRKNYFQLRKSMLDKNKKIDILSTGIPAFVTEASSGIVMFLFNFLILRLTGNFLTGMEYQPDASPESAKEIVKRFAGHTPAAIVLTGVERDGEIGELIYSDGVFSEVWAKKLPRRFHGTGDLFASVFTASYLQGSGLAKACASAGSLVAASINATDSSCTYGVNFEYALNNRIN